MFVFLLMLYVCLISWLRKSLKNLVQLISK